MVFEVVVDPIGRDQCTLQHVRQRGSGVAQPVISVAGHRVFSNIAHAAEELKPCQKRQHPHPHKQHGLVQPPQHQKQTQVA